MGAEPSGRCSTLLYLEMALGIAPVLAVLAAFGVVWRAGEFALSKPAREILFTVIAREEKYKAKNVGETAILLICSAQLSANSQQLYRRRRCRIIQHVQLVLGEHSGPI